MRTYNDLLNRIIKMNSLKDQISFLEYVIYRISDDEKTKREHDDLIYYAKKILLTLKEGTDSKIIQNSL